MVVIVIAAMLATLGIIYGSEGRNQVSLSVETAKVSQLILQAKQLAIATYNTNQQEPACGYGMYFNYVNSTYSLFIYSPQVARVSPYICPTFTTTETTTFSFANDAVEYSQQSWHVPVTPGLALKSVNAGNGIGPSAVAVLFFPPNPQTLIVNVLNASKFTTSTAYVDITTAGGATSTITITPAGQVTF